MSLTFSTPKSKQVFLRSVFVGAILLLSILGQNARALDMAGDEKTKTFVTGWLGVRIDNNEHIFICQNGKFVNNHCYDADSVKHMSKGRYLERAPMLFLQSYLEFVEKRPVEVTDISYPNNKLLVKYRLRDEGAAAYVPPEFNDQTVYYPIRDENGEKKEPSPLVSTMAGLIALLLMIAVTAVLFCENLDPIFNFFEWISDRFKSTQSRTRATSQLTVTTTPTKPTDSSPTATNSAVKSNDDKPKPRKIFI